MIKSAKYNTAIHYLVVSLMMVAQLIFLRSVQEQMCDSLVTLDMVGCQSLSLPVSSSLLLALSLSISSIIMDDL